MKLNTLLAAVMILLTACNSSIDDGIAVATPDGFLKSFELVLNNSVYHAQVDGSGQQATIHGIEYGGYVTGVNYKLEAGASISPQPESLLRDWRKSTLFTVSKDGESAEYRVELPDLVGREPTSPNLGGGEILFFDDFDGEGATPDASKWQLMSRGEDEWNKHVSESYDQAYVANGNLVLKSGLVDGEFVVGGIELKDKMSFEKMRVEIRAKVDEGANGVSPWFHLIPKNSLDSELPIAGTLDIFSRMQADGKITQGVHSKYVDIDKNVVPSPSATKSYSQDGYNIYAVEITKEAIYFYVDDVLTLKYPNLYLENETGQYPFLNGHYLSLSHMVHIASSQTSRIAIDWVKVMDMSHLSHEQVVMGYMAMDDGQFPSQFPQQNWKHLTHVLASFGYVRADGSLNTTAMDIRIDVVRDKARENGVKILASFLSDAAGEFEEAIQSDATRTVLAQNIVDYTRNHDLDGFDIDYEEYTNLNANVPNLLLFFQKLRELKDEDMLMTCAVNPGGWLDYGTEWHTYFDYVNLMSYDNFEAGNKDTPSQHASYADYVADIERWNTRNQVPLSKLVGGLPFYGFSWDDIPGVDGSKGIRYYSIIEHYEFNPDVMNSDQIGNTYYNGHNTIRRKCEYAKEKQLGGVMIWQIFQDARHPEHKLLNTVADVILP